jgi:homoserine dehydrogenase
MVQAPAITEITMSGPGAGGLATATAVLGDVVSILAGDAPVHRTLRELPIVSDVASSFYVHLEVADRPGVLAAVADVLGQAGISVKSMVQRGAGEQARLVMVLHETSERAFYGALSELGKLDFMRADPRAIRVIEEQFG